MSYYYSTEMMVKPTLNMMARRANKWIGMIRTLFSYAVFGLSLFDPNRYLISNGKARMSSKRQTVLITVSAMPVEPLFEALVLNPTTLTRSTII